jgi:hypothetical protein
MEADVQLHEIRRTRWRQFRDSIGLLEVGQDRFARHGPASRLPSDNAVGLLLVVGQDPLGTTVDPSVETWAWWKESARVVVRGAPALTLYGLVRRTENGEKWKDFVALLWNGGIERGMALGRSEDGRVSLKRISSYVESTVNFLGSEARLAEATAGPFEVTFAFSGVAGTALMPFTWEAGYEVGDCICQEDALLGVLEFDELPEDLTRRILYRVAASWNVEPSLVDRALETKSG